MNAVAASDRDAVRVERQDDGSIVIESVRGDRISLSRESALRLAARLCVLCDPARSYVE